MFRLNKLAAGGVNPVNSKAEQNKHNESSYIITKHSVCASTTPILHHHGSSSLLSMQTRTPPAGSAGAAAGCWGSAGRSRPPVQGLQDYKQPPQFGTGLSHQRCPVLFLFNRLNEPAFWFQASFLNWTIFERSLARAPNNNKAQRVTFPETYYFYWKIKQSLRLCEANKPNPSGGKCSARCWLSIEQ